MQTEDNAETQYAQDQSDITQPSNEKYVKMTVGSDEVMLALSDAPAADSLYNMLPLELDFSDYNNTEKITYPPETLTTEGNSFGVTPLVGDICLYVLWGNICIFYNDFSYSNDLVLLGKVESGMEILTAQNGDFKAVLEKSE